MAEHPVSEHDPARVTPRQAWKLGLLTLGRVLMTLGVLLAIYYLLPLDDDVGPSLLIWLAGALVLLAVLAVFEVRSILRSPLPRMRAIEALTTMVPLLCLVFATTYYLMSEATASNFTESLSRTDALYFVLTIFSTVGFGDIDATSPAARAVVTAHIALNLVIVGLGLRIVAGAMERSRERN